MAGNVWFRIAGLSGASSIGIAAYGAHGLKVDDQLQRTFENGNRLHMIHSGMLALCPLLKRPHLSGSFFLCGVSIFSGSCYYAVASQDRSNGRYACVHPHASEPCSSILLLTGIPSPISCHMWLKSLHHSPIGGTALILGWLTLLL